MKEQCQENKLRCEYCRREFISEYKIEICDECLKGYSKIIEGIKYE